MNDTTKLYVLTVLVGEFDMMETFVLGVFSSEEKAEERITRYEEENELTPRSWPKHSFSIEATTLDSGEMEDCER